MIKNKRLFLVMAEAIIQWYREGSDLTEEQTHVLYDCAAEHAQILDNVIHTSWFKKALAENLEALDFQSAPKLVAGVGQIFGVEDYDGDNSEPEDRGFLD